MVFATRLDELGSNRISIAIADTETATRDVARMLAQQLRERCLAADVTEQLVMPPTDVSALVLGTSGAPRSLAALGELIAAARAELATVATALFIVRHDHARDPMRALHETIEQLDWRPDLAAVLEADEPHHGHLLRWVVHKLRPHHEWSIETAIDAARLADAISVGLHRADELHLLRAPHSSRSG